MKKIIFTTLFFGFVTLLFAQQEPQFTHFTFNRQQVNPAYDPGGGNEVSEPVTLGLMLAGVAAAGTRRRWKWSKKA